MNEWLGQHVVLLQKSYQVGCHLDLFVRLVQQVELVLVQ